MWSRLQISWCHLAAEDAGVKSDRTTCRAKILERGVIRNTWIRGKTATFLDDGQICLVTVNYTKIIDHRTLERFIQVNGAFYSIKKSRVIIIINVNLWCHQHHRVYPLEPWILLRQSIQMKVYRFHSEPNGGLTNYPAFKQLAWPHEWKHSEAKKFILVQFVIKSVDVWTHNFSQLVFWTITRPTQTIHSPLKPTVNLFAPLQQRSARSYLKHSRSYVTPAGGGLTVI